MRGMMGCSGNTIRTMGMGRLTIDRTNNGNSALMGGVCRGGSSSSVNYVINLPSGRVNHGETAIDDVNCGAPPGHSVHVINRTNRTVGGKAGAHNGGIMAHDLHGENE